MEDSDPAPIGLTKALIPFVGVLTQFARGAMSADDFEMQFNAQYRADTNPWSDAVFDVLDGFFADVDEYVADTQIRDPANGDLGPEELREKAVELLRRAGYEV